MSDEAVTPATIWENDLFGRKDEAETLIGYLECMAKMPSFREDAQGFTLAIDARYGEGKTFFLKRLAQQLSLNHPVAFVDAWADDLADEPLTALAATLKKALDPLIKQSPDIRSKFDTVMEKTGRIVKIVGMGLLKKGASAAIGSVAVQAAENALAGASEALKDGLEDQVKDSGKDAVEIAEKAFTSVAPGKLMDDRIARFEEGQKAINEMRASLAALVDALTDTDLHAPIYIVIDELDRCRPTYAVKLLEEIKHLFDVKGLVFILGLHADQLSHSVRGAYGSGFDGAAYLRRFFHRQYALAQPYLEPLVLKLAVDMGLESARFDYPGLVRANYTPEQPPAPRFIARYMQAYGLAARDAFEVMGIIQTCHALVGSSYLHLPYLLPLIFGFMKGLEDGQLPELDDRKRWLLFIQKDRFGHDGDEHDFATVAQAFQNAVEMSKDELAEAYRTSPINYPIRTVYNSDNGSSTVLSSVRNYPRLLRTVRRFGIPNSAQ